MTWWFGVAMAAGLEIDVAPGETLVPAEQAARELGRFADHFTRGVVVRDGSELHTGVFVAERVVGWIDPTVPFDADALLHDSRDAQASVMSWVEPPAYDPETRRLSYAMNVDSLVVGSVVLLGREGYAAATKISAAEDWVADRADLHAFAGRMRFTEGHRHEDYVPALDSRAGGLAVVFVGRPAPPWRGCSGAGPCVDILFVMFAVGVFKYSWGRKVDRDGIPDVDD